MPYLQSMSDIARKTIRQSLLKKGFIQEKGKRDHDYFYFQHNGKKFKHICARLSRGSGYKSYQECLWKLMKIRLQFDNKKDLENLLRCPMSKENYEAFLQKKGQIKISPEKTIKPQKAKRRNPK